MADAPDMTDEGRQRADVIRALALRREPASAEAHLHRLLQRPDLLHCHLNRVHNLPGPEPTDRPLLPVMHELWGRRPAARTAGDGPARHRFEAGREPGPPPPQQPAPFRATSADVLSAIDVDASDGSSRRSGTGPEGPHAASRFWRVVRDVLASWMP